MYLWVLCLSGVKEANLPDMGVNWIKESAGDKPT